MVAFILQSLQASARACRRDRLASLSFAVCGLLLLPGLLRDFAFWRWRQVYACSARFGQPDSDRLLSRPRPVLAFTDVLDLLSNEFASLRARRFTFTRSLLRSLNGLFFRHKVPPIDKTLIVTINRWLTYTNPLFRLTRGATG